MFAWMEEKIKVMKWYDISFIKLATAAFILMIAKLWTPLLSLEWHWYLVIALLACIRPWYMMFKK